MDIDVNTEAFKKASSCLDKHCRIIVELTKALQNQIKRANQEFDDINYKRVSERANNIIKEVNNFNYKVDSLKKVLSKLNDIVDEYSRGGYKSNG